MNNTIIYAILGTLFTFSVNATTYYLKKDGAATSKTTAFRNASFWLDENNTPSGEDGATLDPNADYIMNHPLRQENTSLNAHFGGASLRIGENASVRPHFMQYYNADTSFDKLYFTSGYYACNRGHDMTYNLTADITVDSAAGNHFVLALSYTNSQLNIKGSLSASIDTCLYLCTTSPAYTTKKQMTDYHLPEDDSWHTFTFDTDMSEFYGTLKLGRTTSKYIPATPSSWQIKALFPKTMSLPGSLIVPSYDILSVANSATFTVKNLTLEAGSMLEFDDSNPVSFGTIVVSDNLTVNGPISVNLGDASRYLTAGGRFTLLTAPNTDECTFLSTDFVPVSAWNWSELKFEVEIDEESNTRNLVLVAPRWLPDNVVTMVKSDNDTKDYKENRPDQRQSALTNALHWSNNIVPNGDYDYYVGPVDTTLNGRALRTPFSDTNQTFPGRSLTIGRNCLLMMPSQMTFNDLRLLNGSILAGINTGIEINGNIHAPNGSVRLRQYAHRQLTLNCTITGEAELVLEGWNATTSPDGSYSLAKADMSGFKGTIRITEHPAMPIPDYKFKGTNQTLKISSYYGETQLGGKLDSFNPKALTIERNGTLALSEGNTINITTNYNRGIYINGDGRIYVQSTHHTMKISTRLTVNGTLVKDGEGSLILSGDCVTEGESSIFDIWTNNVVVASAYSINGLSVHIGKGANLILKVNPEDEEFLTYGIRMEKAETPFILKDGINKIPLTLDCSAMMRPASAIELGICTVSLDAADTIEAILPAFTSPFKHMNTSIIRRNNSETDTVTFALRLTPKGFTMVFR